MKFRICWQSAFFRNVSDRVVRIFCLNVFTLNFFTIKEFTYADDAENGVGFGDDAGRIEPVLEEDTRLNEVTLTLKMSSKSSHNLHKIISTHLLTVLTIGAILITVIRKSL